MPDGNLRRPPQPWESRLGKVTRIVGAGVSAGNASSIVPDPAPPGVGGGIEPAPVLPPPGDFIAPSTPTLITSVQGINVVWNGLNSAGDLWPSDTSYVEVHMDTTGPTFTVGTATLKGRLARPGGLSVVGLDRGTTYYFRLRGADPAGNVTAAGSAASGQPGQISAPDIAANAITANSIVAGTITGWSINSAYLSGGTVSGGFITGGTISGGVITSTTVSGYLTPADIGSSGTTTIDGGRITTGTVSATRIDVDNLTVKKLESAGTNNRRIVIGAVGNTDNVQFLGTSNTGFTLGVGAVGTNLFLAGTAGSFEVTPDTNFAGSITADNLTTEANLVQYNGYRTTTTATDTILRLRSNVTTTAQAKFEVLANGDVQSRTNSYAGFSDARLKDNIKPARDYLDDLRRVKVVTYTWRDSDDKQLGVTAQQIKDVFPSLVQENDEGDLSVKYSVFVPMLITAVQSLAAQVDTLTARIEALEG